MKSKALLWWGLLAGAIAIAALVVGLLFFVPDNSCGRGAYDYSGMMSGYGGMMGPGAGIYGGMMGGGMMGGGMMGGGPADVATAPLSIDQAATAAKRYVDSWNNSDLKVKEVLEFTNGFYARVEEQSTGAGAFELLIDRNSGITYPEPGPNMMWNTKYGAWKNWGTSNGGGMMGGGMMGPGYGRSGYGPGEQNATTDMPITKLQARDRAQQFLDRQLPGTKAGEPEVFYGYYTVEVEKDGHTLGMSSVHGYYGQVWYHSWHGAYLGEKKL